GRGFDPPGPTKRGSDRPELRRHAGNRVIIGVFTGEPGSPPSPPGAQKTLQSGGQCLSRAANR
ncbi:MAG: hypothetical protein J4O01_07925, partial [Chloroflexi bacterium]|nr:hypothetical protein [Chloroflexota bacterium]